MDTNQSSTPILGIIGAITGLLLFGFSMLMSWRALVRLYPDTSFFADHSFAGLSGRVGGGFFRGSLCLALGDNGVRLSTPWPFRLLFPAFVIPWAAVTSCRHEPFGFSSKAIRLEVAGVSATIHLRGFLWRDGDAITTILDYWRDRHSNIQGSTSRSNID